MNIQEIVCFIISTELDELQVEQKNIWRKYMNSNPNIRSFFIEMNDDLNLDTLVTDDTIYFKGQESIIPGIFLKRQKALNYALQNFSNLKYVIQTNLSSFFIWNKMLNLLPKNPPPKFIMGKKWGGFPSGCGSIYGKDVAEIIANSDINPEIEHDDCTVGKILLKHNIHNYDGYYHLSHDFNTIPYHCYHLRSRIEPTYNLEQRFASELPFLKKALEIYYPDLLN